jgi:hypothetical protein
LPQPTSSNARTQQAHHRKNDEAGPRRRNKLIPLLVLGTGLNRKLFTGSGSAEIDWSDTNFTN